MVKGISRVSDGEPISLTTVVFMGEQEKARLFKLPVPMSFMYKANKSDRSLKWHILKAMEEYNWGK